MRSPRRENANQLTAPIAQTAAANTSAANCGAKAQVVATSAAQSKAVAIHSPLGAQSGRLSVTPLRICSRICAWASTPGIWGDNGVATMSDSVTALAPKNTIAPRRSLRSAPGVSAFHAGIERRGSGRAKYGLISPAASVSIVRSPLRTASTP